MREESVWEVKLLPYMCIGVLIVTLIAILDYLIKLSGTQTAIIIQMSGLMFFTVLSVTIAIKANPKNYPQLLLILILGFHALTNLILFGGDFDDMRPRDNGYGLSFPFNGSLGESLDRI